MAKALVLMCRDVPVLRFSYDATRPYGTSRVAKGFAVLSEPLFPLGALDATGRPRAATIDSWLRSRAVPQTRPDLTAKLSALGFSDPASLMIATYGFSLSDQYWVRPEDAPASWSALNPYDNEFDPALGEHLVAHDPDSDPLGQAADPTGRLLAGSRIVASSTPDAALNGNLPKRWVVRDGVRLLLKEGREANLFQEPANEAVATALCRRILAPGDYVPYAVEKDDRGLPVSTCPLMTSPCLQFVCAADLVHHAPPLPSENMHQAYLRVAHDLGADVEARVEQTAVVDWLLANRDRHWGNFGVLQDSRTGALAGPAPLFDTGESLFCDNVGLFTGRLAKPAHPMPFFSHTDSTLDRVAANLSWLELGRLQGFPDEAAQVLAAHSLADAPRIRQIAARIRERIRHLEALAARLARTGRGISFEPPAPERREP